MSWISRGNFYLYKRETFVEHRPEFVIQIINNTRYILTIFDVNVPIVTFQFKFHLHFMLLSGISNIHGFPNRFHNRFRENKYSFMIGSYKTCC